MEQQKLPNVTLAIILSIVGYVCCCFWGVPTFILGLIAFLLLRSDLKKYLANPEVYTNYNQWKTARILAVIAIAVGLAYFIFMLIRIYQLGGWEAAMEQSRALLEQWGIE